MFQVINYVQDSQKEGEALVLQQLQVSDKAIHSNILD